MSARSPAEPILCPSARAEPGALIIGVLGQDGRVAHLKDRLEIDQAFIDEVSVDARPEQLFRFSSPCVEHGCAQWDGCKCKVIETVQAQLAPPDDAAGSLPVCSIRTACRWFNQTGPEACRLCPLVVTDTREAVEAL